MATIVNAKFKQKRGTEASIPVLLEGELYVCIDSNKLYVGTASGNQLICDISKLNDIENNKLDKSKGVNNCSTTEEGFYLDARQGKYLLEKINNIFSINTTTTEGANDLPVGISFVDGTNSNNVPESNFMFIITIARDENVKSQIAITVIGNMYFRIKNAGSWNSWKRISATNI